MYCEAYKNTFAVDILEYFGLVKLYGDFESTLNTASATKKEVQDFSIQNDETEKASTSSAAINTSRDHFLVEFNGPDDPEHPHNWSSIKTTAVVFNIMLLTCITYMGSSFYTPGQEMLQKEFHVGHVVGTLNLSLYVLGYGLGPLVFSPLSEFAIFGRQRLFIVTLFLFCMLQIGCALVRNIGGLIILRFLAGILCSPSLATGAACVGEVVRPHHIPIFIGLWSIGAVAAPASGPLLGASMLVAKNWRFMFWLLMWLSAATLLLLIFFLPETNEDNILYRRCKRIRDATGDNRYYTRKSQEESKLTFADVAMTTLYRPFEIIIKEPIVLALNIYHALCYGVFYLFFEAFPIVFLGIYHFTAIELGLSYMGFCIGCILAYLVALTFFLYYVPKKIANQSFIPETFLVLSIWVCWTLPLSLFLFGWAASVHWILPVISEAFFMIGQFNLFQSIFSYLAVSYPKYMASVFAGNNVCRAGFACAFTLFGQAMYENLSIDGYPVGWGSSLVGLFSIALAVIPFLLYKYGPYLRKRSSFTG